MKKTMFIALFALSFFTTGVSTSFAAWCSAGTIVEVAIFPDLESTTTSMYAIQLDCDDAAWAASEINGSVQVLFIESMGKSAYATALTAMALGQKVSVVVPRVSWNALATRIKLLPTPTP